MISKTKLRWTIDPYNSEIIFTEKEFFLSTCFDQQAIIKEKYSFKNYVPFASCFGKIMQGINNSEEYRMNIEVRENPKKMNYNLVVFKEKNPTPFWERNTFEGLLILPDHHQNILITLYKKEHHFKENGTVNATYYVRGEINTNELSPGFKEPGLNEFIVLQSMIIFEGEIKLVQTDQIRI